MKESKSVEIEYAWRIIQESWDCIQGKRVMFFFTALVVAIITLVLSAIPIIGAVANGLLSSYLGAGLILLIHRYINSREFQFDTIFEALSNRELFKKIFPLAIFMAVWNGMFALVGVVMNFSSGDVQGQIFGVGLTMIGAMLLSIFTYFAIPLILFDNYSVFEAMSSSAEALAKNIILFFVYSIVITFVLVVATIPLGVGLFFIFGPLSCHSYLFYRKIYKQ